MHAHYKHISSYFQEAKKGSQMAISSSNSMNCHLYVKGICIILIEYFYYCVHGRTADSEKCTEKGKSTRCNTVFSQSRGELFLTVHLQVKQNMHDEYLQIC